MSPPAGRKVRLATVHFRPAGKSPADNRQEFAPLIAEAARQKADLVVLGETLTYFGTGKTFADVAEPVPGPSTDYFGTLAKKHNLYIVAGPDRARRAPGLQRRGADRPRRQGGRQVPQGLPAAQRDRGRHRAGRRVSRSSRRASARSG